MDHTKLIINFKSYFFEDQSNALTTIVKLSDILNTWVYDFEEEQFITCFLKTDLKEQDIVIPLNELDINLLTNIPLALLSDCALQAFMPKIMEAYLLNVNNGGSSSCDNFIEELIKVNALSKKTYCVSGLTKYLLSLNTQQSWLIYEWIKLYKEMDYQNNSDELNQILDNKNGFYWSSFGLYSQFLLTLSSYSLNYTTIQSLNAVINLMANIAALEYGYIPEMNNILTKLITVLKALTDNNPNRQSFLFEYQQLCSTMNTTINCNSTITKSFTKLPVIQGAFSVSSCPHSNDPYIHKIIFTWCLFMYDLLTYVEPMQLKDLNISEELMEMIERFA